MFLVRKAQLCKILGISRTTLWRLQTEGKLPPTVKVSSKIEGWRQSDLSEWMNTNTSAA